MKCNICNKRIEITFMNKIIGTVYTKGKKQYHVCNDCQSRHTDKELREKLNL